MRVFAQGFANAEEVGKVFKQFLASVFPFQKDIQAADDAQMKAFMEKEVSRGPIVFKQVEENFFKQRAKQYSMPDEHLSKLREQASARRGLRR